MTIDQRIAEGIAIAALDQADLPPEIAIMVGAGIAGMEPGMLMNLIGDALEAKSCLEMGDKDGARIIMDRYKDMAESMGLGQVFATMFGEMVEAPTVELKKLPIGPPR